MHEPATQSTSIGAVVRASASTSRRDSGLPGHRRVKSDERPARPVSIVGNRRADRWTVPLGFSTRAPTTAVSGCASRYPTMASRAPAITCVSGFRIRRWRPVARRAPAFTPAENPRLSGVGAAMNDGCEARMRVRSASELA